MIVEPAVFSEDWEDVHATFKAVSKHFPDAKPLFDDGYGCFTNTTTAPTRRLEKQPFRGSMNMARAMGERFEFANCLNWMPKLRPYLVNPTYKLMGFRDIVAAANRNGVGEGIFVRPVSPLKEFSGQLFTQVSKLENEFIFRTKNMNLDPDMLCVVAPPKKLVKEFRCIFVDRKLVTTTLYMLNGEPLKSKGNFAAPYQVCDFAQKVAADPYFDNIFEFVLDVSVNDRLEYHLVEVNAFNTASFYNADLNLIYKAWAAALNVGFNLTDKQVFENASRPT